MEQLVPVGNACFRTHTCINVISLCDTEAKIYLLIGHVNERLVSVKKKKSIFESFYFFIFIRSFIQSAKCYIFFIFRNSLTLRVLIFNSSITFLINMISTRDFATVSRKYSPHSLLMYERRLFLKLKHVFNEDACEATFSLKTFSAELGKRAVGRSHLTPIQFIKRNQNIRQ